MDRRYLVATLAIVATFASLNHGLRSGQLAVLSGGFGALAGGQCVASRMLAKIRERLQPGYPEEAQMLAELNVPMIRAQARMTEQAARRDSEVAKCAREEARQQAERARREVQIIREKMVRVKGSNAMMPIVSRNGMGIDMQVEISQATTRMAAQQSQLAMASEQLANMSDEIARQVDLQMANGELASLSGDSHQPCAFSHKTQIVVRNQIRNSMHVMQNSINNRVHAMQTAVGSYY
jgi:hypothetical protein